jgi:hypothetical protein
MMTMHADRRVRHASLTLVPIRPRRRGERRSLRTFSSVSLPEVMMMMMSADRRVRRDAAEIDRRAV